MIDPGETGGVVTSERSFDDYVASVLTGQISAPAAFVGERIAELFPGSAVLIYGSGISVSADEDPTAVMFDYYVIAPSYQRAFPGRIERWAAQALPPNVYYFETPSPMGVLRAKYAVLSADHFEKLVSRKTFHSYFWARFAQPSRIVSAPSEMQRRILNGVKTAARTFLSNARGLAAGEADWRAIWLAGMNASYRAELRAESGGRAEKLVESYGRWPQRLAEYALADAGAEPPSRASGFAWRLRAIQGGFLSVARLLKATATFHGGIDYIAWKIQRHTGIDLQVKPWERRLPLIAAPVVALRYYRMRGARR
ncbi:MAG: hypothetical protein KDA46_01815 [Parvularculaceae bacterium]|nr:hypothetical protein [Parvularculaceae bacterium]